MHLLEHGPFMFLCLNPSLNCDLLFKLCTRTATKFDLTEWFTSTQNTCPTLQWFIISDVAYKCYLKVGLVTCLWPHTSHALYLQAHKDMMRASYGLTDRLTGACGA